MLRDFLVEEDRAAGVEKQKTDLRHQIGFVFGSVLGSSPLRETHIRAFARSTVAAPGPVGGTDFLGSVHS